METFRAIGSKLRAVLVLKTEDPCGVLGTKTIVLGDFFNSSEFWSYRLRLSAQIRSPYGTSTGRFGDHRWNGCQNDAQNR